MKPGPLFKQTRCWMTHTKWHSRVTPEQTPKSQPRELPGDSFTFTLSFPRKKAVACRTSAACVELWQELEEWQLASITCSHARSVASEQFKNSETPNRPKTFKPKQTNGLENNVRKQHCCERGTSTVLKNDVFFKETNKTLEIKCGRNIKHFYRTSIISKQPGQTPQSLNSQGYKLLLLPSFQT